MVGYSCQRCAPPLGSEPSSKSGMTPKGMETPEKIFVALQYGAALGYGERMALIGEEIVLTETADDAERLADFNRARV